jgi:hypothetical protein
MRERTVLLARQQYTQRAVPPVAVLRSTGAVQPQATLRSLSYRTEFRREHRTSLVPRGPSGDMSIISDRADLRVDTLQETFTTRYKYITM